METTTKSKYVINYTLTHKGSSELKWPASLEAALEHVRKNIPTGDEVITIDSVEVIETETREVSRRIWTP